MNSGTYASSSAVNDKSMTANNRKVHPWTYDLDIVARIFILTVTGFGCSKNYKEVLAFVSFMLIHFENCTRYHQQPLWSFVVPEAMFQLCSSLNRSADGRVEHNASGIFSRHICLHVEVRN